jgi:hypothetical protein
MCLTGHLQYYFPYMKQCMKLELEVSLYQNPLNVSRYGIIAADKRHVVYAPFFRHTHANMNANLKTR